MPKTFVVIGSNCFTGSHIVDALLDDPAHHVIGISRSPEYRDIFLPYKHRAHDRFTFYQIDLVRQFETLVELLDRKHPDVVVNVAALSEVALSHERPIEYFDVNTLGVAKLCHHLRACNYLKHYIHISSAEIFGSCDTPVNEETRFHPSTPYAVSKAAADMYLATLRTNFGFPVSIIRSTNVYGRYQQLFKIIPRTIIYIKLGKTIELHGGGQSIKSFIHVRDVVQGMMRVIERNAYGTFHLSVASEQTVAGIVRQICDWLGHDFEQATENVGERLGQDSRYWLDCSKAQRELDWRPELTFAVGVCEVIEWIERYWEHIRHEPLSYQHRV